MTCPRCNGLLTIDTAEDTVIWNRVTMQRCINCGNSFDEQSQKNRIEHPDPRKEHSRNRTYRLPKEKA